MIKTKYIKLAFFVLLVGVLSRSNILKNGFVGDDHTLIINNGFIKDFNNARIILSPVYIFRTYPIKLGARPLTLLSLMTDYKIWGMNPLGYHMSSLLLHAVNGALVFLIIILLLNSDGVLGRPARLSAFYGALFFLLHPVQSEVVNVISYRADLLATFFCLISLSVFLCALYPDETCSGFRKRSLFGLSGFVFLLALFSKEIAVTLPVVMIIYLFLFRDKVNLKKGIYKFGSILLFLSCVFLIFFWRTRFRYELDKATFFNIKDNIFPLGTPIRYFNTMTASFWHYIKTVAWPVNLSFDYQVYIPDGILNSLNIYFILALAAVLLMIRNSSRKLLIFGAGFAFVSYIPLSNIWPLLNTVTDRYMYLSMAGVSICFSVLLSDFLIKKNSIIIHVPAVILLSLYAYMSFNRNSIFRDSLTLHENTVRVSPENIRARYNLGIACMENQEYEKAIEQFQTVSGQNSSYKQKEISQLLGIAYLSTGEILKSKECFEKALTLRGNKSTLNNYANALWRMGYLGEAKSALETSLAVFPDAVTFNNLGAYYQQIGEPSLALDYYLKAVRLAPYYKQASLNLLEMYILLKESEKARYLQTAIEKL